jgi:CRP-like cAMP-binding protein
MASRHDNCQKALTGVSLFSELGKTQQRSLARLMTSIKVPAGQVLTTEGKPGREFMIIMDGQASVRRGNQLVATLRTGDFLGEMSLITGTPQSATVTAETDMVLEILNRREFSSLLDESPTVARKVMVGAVRRLQEVAGDAIV